MMNSGPTMEQIKTGMRAMWMAGDFGVIAKRIGGSAGEPFAAQIELRPGDRVLDVACGTGNVTLPLARRGAMVTGLDLAPNLLVQARERAAAEGLTIPFDEGDAEALPYGDGAFDVVVTMFGAMFAPRPEIVAAEFGRVLKPGGLLAMANWTPMGVSGQMFRVGGQHVPPPPGIVAPVLWGDAAVVEERLTAEFREIRTKVVAMDFDLAMNAAGAVAFFRRYFGPTQMAFNRLDEAGQAALEADLEALWSGANVAADPAAHTLIKNEYLQVMAVRR